MKKIIITGAAGLLGQNLIANFDRQDQLLCVDIAANPFPEYPNIKYLKADLTDFDSVYKELIGFNPDFIFNCAALSDVDACESMAALANKLNVELVEYLLKIPCEKLIHYSSDYVFDGEHGPYSESDTPHPINYYGQTKFQSEKILAGSKSNYLIIRTNVLYGRAKNVKPSFVDWVGERLKREDTLKIAGDQYNNPTLAVNLAMASIEFALKDLTGVIHIAGTEYLSRYDMAIKIAGFLGLPIGLIEKVTSDVIAQKAKRPHRGGLAIAKAAKLLSFELVGFTEGLRGTL